MEYRARISTLFALLVIAGCGGAPDYASNRDRVREGEAPLNLLVITLDTTRADRLGCYGYDKAVTPNIDALAETGVLFEKAMSPVPLTVPSHASIFTGTMPPYHGVHTNEGKLLDEPNLCLAEIVKERGYATGAFLAAAVLERNCGLMQGFDTYSDDFSGNRGGTALAYPEKPAEEVVRDTIGWVREKRDVPFFAWVHLFDPHAPYQPRPVRDTPRPDNPYDGEITYADYWIGELIRSLENLGIRDNTLVVFLSDHGEGLGEHDEATHGFFVYDTTIRVPLILSCKKLLPAGTRIESLVRTTDLVPTLLDLLGEPIDDEIQGVSLLSCIDGGPSEVTQAYAETYYPNAAFGWSPLLALRKESWKVIMAPRPELYDMASDANEISNLFESRAETGTDLLAELEARTTELSRSGVSASRTLDAQSRAMLARLGYLAESGGNAAEVKPEPGSKELADPKDGVRSLRELEQASRLVSAGESEQAQSLLEDLIRREPRCTSAFYLLGEIFVKREDYSSAEDVYYRLLSQRREDEVALINLASIYRATERPRKCVPFLERALQGNPTNADALIMLADIEQNVLRRPEKAREYFERFLEVAPSDPYAPRVRETLENL